METHGRFAVYNGMEYKVCETKPKIMLISEDESSMEYGFVQHIISDDVYVLEVTKDEIEQLYRKQLWGRYKGYDFPIFYETDDMYCLFGGGGKFNDSDILDELDFKMVGRLEWEKEVPKSEMECVWWDVKDLLEKEK